MEKITIITTVFNSVETIADCIKSVKSQTYRPVEHIVIDGNSTDGTLEIIKAYEKYLACVVSEKDDGVYDGMNKGLKLATGDIVGILNADDFYSGPWVLEKVVKAFSSSGVESCYGDLAYVDHQHTDRIVRFWRSGEFYYKRFYWGWMPPHPTFFVRREVYERHGYFNLRLGSAADYELMLRFLLKYRISTTYIPEVLVKMRTGGVSNASLRNRILANRNDRLAWKINNLKPYPWTLFLKPLRKLPQFFVFGKAFRSTPL